MCVFFLSLELEEEDDFNGLRELFVMIIIVIIIISNYFS